MSVEKISQRKGRRQITLWQINDRTSWVCECAGCYRTGTVVICIFLRIVEDTVCLVLTLMIDMNNIWICFFVGGSDWGTLGGACRGSTPPYPCCPKTSSLHFWLGIVYNFDTTKILVIVVSRGRGDELSVAILCISILSVVIPVPYLRGCCRSSLSRPWWRGGLQNSGCTAFLSASQYFNIIVWGLLECVVSFFHLGHHPCPCNWRVRPPLLRFDPFSLLLELSSLLDLAIAQYLLDPIVFNRYHYLCRVLSCWLK